MFYLELVCSSQLVDLKLLRHRQAVSYFFKRDSTHAYSHLEPVEGIVELD